MCLKKKPEEEVREKLKSYGFKWSRKQKIWYAKDDKYRRDFLATLGKQIESVGEECSSEEQKENLEQIRKEAKIRKLEWKLERLRNSQGGHEPWNKISPFPENMTRRANSNFSFGKGRDWNAEYGTIIGEAEEEVEKLLKYDITEADKKELEYELERFKKDIYNNMLSQISNDASHPSVLIAGPAKFNHRKADKQFERTLDLASTGRSVEERFENAIDRVKSRIWRSKLKDAKEKVNQIIENIDVTIKFRRKKLKLEYEVTAYYSDHYYTANYWGAFRIYESATNKEIMHFDRLHKAKAWMQHLENQLGMEDNQ